MGFLSHYSDVERIDVTPPGSAEGPFYVSIKKYLTGDEFEAAKRALSTVKVADSGITPEPDIAAYQRELIVASVLDWNLTDENDQVLPLAPLADKRISVGKLPETVLAQLLLKINESNEPRTTEDKVNFPDATQGSAGDG